MADDVFRGRAVIVDQMTPGLRAIREEFARMNRGISTSASGSRREVDALRNSFRLIGSEIRGFTLPALSAMGLAGGGLAASVIGIAGAVKGYADKIQDLGNSSRELGLSARNIRAFELAANNVRINPGQALAGLETFKKNAEDFQLKIGGLRDELRKLGAGDVVEAIRAAKDPLDQMRIAFERMEELQKRNPAVAKRFAEAMFGSAQFARMGWDELRAAMTKVGDLTEEEFRRAERLNKKWNEIGKSFETLKDKILGGPLSDNMQSTLGAANKGADALGKLLGKIPDSPGLGSEVVPLDPNQRAPSQPSNGELRLPKMIDPRRREDTQEGTKKGVSEGMEEFFQKHSSSQTGGGGFMNASLGGTSGSLPSGGGGGSGRWGNGQFPELGRSDGTSGGTLPGGVDRSGAAAPPAGAKSENAKRIYSELRKLGHSHEQASAALGHAHAESKFNPGAVGDRGTAFGFWQHRGKRWQLAQKMAKDAGASPFSPEQAARHFDFELRNGERASGNRYFNSKSTRDAVTALNGYERFAGWQHGQRSRYSSAEGFAKSMSGTPESVARNRDMIGGVPVTDAEKAGVVGGGGRGSFADRWGDRVDGALGGRDMGSATGTVNLNVTAPAGTKVEGKADGMFKEMAIKRYRQMNETGLGGGE